MERSANYNTKQTAMKFVTLGVLICFIFVFFLSEAFILTHAEHKHDHNGAKGSCTTCIQIHNAENLLRQFNLAVSGASFAFISLLAAIAILFSLSYLNETKTLVILKTRMNN